MFGCGGFDFAVDFGSEEEHKAGEIEPHEQDRDGPEGAVGGSVAIEEMEVEAEAERGDEPSKDTNGGAGGEPAPLTAFYVRAEVVDDGEGECEESGGEGPAGEVEEEGEGVGDPGVVEDAVGEVAEVVGPEHGGED